MATNGSSETAKQIRLIARLISYQIAGSKPVAQGAPILSRLGMGAAEIAVVFDTTSNAVNARLGEAKRRGRKRRRRPS